MSFELLILLCFVFSFIVAFAVFKLSKNNDGLSEYAFIFRGSAVTYSFLASINILMFVSYSNGVEFHENIAQNFIDYPWGGPLYLALTAVSFYLAKRL